MLKKQYVVLMALLCSSHVFAQVKALPEAQPQSPSEASSQIIESRLTDLMYFPLPGTLTGESKLLSTSGEIEYEYLGNRFVTSETNAISISQDLSYTFTQAFRAGVSVSYQLSEESENSYGPGSTLNGSKRKTKKAKGMEDPTLFATTRIIPYSADTLMFDATVRFSPKVGDAKFSTTSAKGNGHRGGSLLEVEGDIGKKYSDSSWRAKVNLTYTMDQESKSASNSNNVSKRDAYTSLGTLFTYQWIVNPTFAFNLSGGLGFMGEIDTKNSFNKENNVIDSGTLVTIGVNFLLNATPNLMFDIGLTGTSAGGQDLTATDTSTNVAVLLTNESTSIGMLSLAAKYEF